MTVLVLAGTSEARAVLENLNGQKVIASLAGVTRAPVDLGVETRVGGFGGRLGFRDYLIKNEIAAVLDATHPFAAQMTETAAAVCKETNIPHSILQRPEWTVSSDDIWHPIDKIGDVVDLIPINATVFIGTGRQTLQDYDCIRDRALLARVLDKPRRPFPFPNGEFLVGTPPFSIQEEVELFKARGVDWLVVKNSGGWKSKSKLDAAAQLGLPVAMIKRPKLPDAQLLTTAEQAHSWVQGYL